MQQRTSIKSIANRIRDVALRLDEERFLPSEKTEKEEQSKRLGSTRLEVDKLVGDICDCLQQRMPAANKVERWLPVAFRPRVYSGINRANLGTHLVNAALLKLLTRLFIIRTDANRTWLEQSVNSPDYRGEVRLATDDFERTLRNAQIGLSAVNFHTIASAIRSWADELSVPATEISGWLEAAIPVSRDLRFLANLYHTRWLWHSVADRHTRGGLRVRATILVKALFDSAFRYLSGYGLRGRRFIGSLALIIVSFGLTFDLVSVLRGCHTWSNVRGSWNYIVTSAAYLVGNGPSVFDGQANMACPGSGSIVGQIGVLETGMGYVMLGIFVSLLWSVVQRRSIDASRLVIPALPSNKRYTLQAPTTLLQSDAVLNTERAEPKTTQSKESTTSGKDT